MSQTKIQNHVGPVPIVPWLKAIPESLKLSIEQTKVQYRRLGNSGLRISNPVLGAMSFGDSQWLDWVLDEEKALPLLKAAYDRGINTWDTANVYSNGASERIIGNSLIKYNIPRHKVVIMTKCHRPMTDDMNPKSIVALLSEEANKSKEYINQHGLSRPAIFRSVEASLRRLRTDYIDVLQIHRFDEDVPPEETMEALHDLVKSGKVHYIGASSMWTYQFSLLQHTAEKNRWTKFISMQNHYNLLYREEEREMNKYCKLTSVGLLPWSPLATGFLARPLSQHGQSIRSQIDLAHGSRFPTGESASDQEIIRRVGEIARKRGWPMSTVALAWLNKRVTAPIVGFSTVERMDEALEALGKELTEEEERFLEEPYWPKEIQGHY